MKYSMFNVGKKKREGTRKKVEKEWVKWHQ
jgi:hypothetical protein